MSRAISSSVGSPPLAAKADRIGASAAFLCAVHCALWPVLIAAVPSLGITFLGQVGFERGFAVFGTLLAVFTLVAGFRRHRTLNALLLLAPGVLGLWLGAFGPFSHQSAGHALAMTIGGSLIAAAHLLNLRLTRLFK